MCTAFWEAKAWRIIEIRGQCAALDKLPPSIEKDTQMIRLMKEEAVLWASIDIYSLPSCCRLVFSVVTASKPEPDLFNHYEESQSAAPRGWNSIDTSVE